jgi:uncharacterized protein (TIGR00369 family)
VPDEPPLDPTFTPPTIPLHDLLDLQVQPEVDGVSYSDVLMPVKAGAFGFTGNLHGGAIATLVDLACAIAAVRATTFDMTRESLVTSDMHLRYVGRPRTANVIGRAEVVRVGSQLIVIDCKVIDEEGHLVAVADLSMMRVTLRTPLDV